MDAPYGLRSKKNCNTVGIALAERRRLLRILYHAPILHNFVDSCRSPETFLMKRVEAFWDTLEESVERLGIRWQSTTIYQDTQVFSAADEYLMRLHRASAKKGSRNSRLILKLLDRGAWLEKTEHPKLIGFRDLYSFDPTPADIFLKKKTASLRERRKQRELEERIFLLRDRYIAHRINHTLKEPRIGLLFLGSWHRMFLRYLSPDIEVRSVLSKKDYYRFLLFVHERKD